MPIPPPGEHQDHRGPARDVEVNPEPYRLIAPPNYPRLGQPHTPTTNPPTMLHASKGQERMDRGGR